MNLSIYDRRRLLYAPVFSKGRAVFPALAIYPRALGGPQGVHVRPTQVFTYLARHPRGDTIAASQDAPASPSRVRAPLKPEVENTSPSPLALRRNPTHEVNLLSPTYW